MAINREAIYAALFDRLQARTSGFVTFERRLLDFSQVPAGAQPALLLLEGDQEAVHAGPQLPTNWKLGAQVLVYARSDALPLTPGTSLLNLVDSIESALERKPDEAGGSPFTSPEDQRYTTLGGKVRRAWISGHVRIDPGTEGEQAIAIVPIEMLVA